MYSWFIYLKHGLARKKPKDKVAQGLAQPNFANLYPFLIRHWPKATLGIILVLLVSTTSYLLPLVQRFLIDKVILDKQLNLLIGVVLLFVGLWVFAKLGSVLQQFYFTRFGQSVALDIQGDLLKRVFSFPKAFFDDKETGYLMSRINNDVQGLRWFFSSTIVYVFDNVFRFFVGAGLLIYLEWRLALGVLVILPGLAICVYYFSSKVRALSHQNMERQANVLRRLQESLASIPLLKSFVSEKREADRVTQALAAAYNVSLEQTAVQSLASLSISSLSDIAKLIILVVGVPLVVGGGWTAGSLFAFFAYQSYVYNPVQFLANTNFQLQNALAALERISAFYEVLPEEHGEGLEVEKLKGEIEFKNVSFSYNGEDSVLDKISFSISAGEHVAIVGPSGVGKTTLISLLLGFYRPKQGEIYFDGCLASQYALDSLRRRIGYVSQSTRLLAGTIMDNLCYGNPGASIEEVKQATRIAEIHDFITGLPQGYDSWLGENGVNLSEGQRQRISIARALIKNPDILILDEPSSSLDMAIEKSIFEALPTVVRNKTMIVVAHRPSTIQAADRTICLT